MKIKNIAYGSILATLVGCSSGGGGGDLPEERPTVEISGNVVDAIITNGDIKAYAWDNGLKGDLIAESVTDSNGFYTLAIQTTDRPLLIEVTNGRYTEEASGVNVEMIEGQTLKSLINFKQGTDINVQVNPYSNLVTCLADYKVRNGANVQNAIIEATSAFSGFTGVDIIGTFPSNITDPTSANFEVTDEIRFGALLAGISSFTAQTSIDNGVTPHRFNQNSSMYFIQVACQDISADGLLNGQGFVNNGSTIGQLALGSVPIDTNTYRTSIAQHLLNIMSSDRNVTGLGVDKFVQFANEFANSTDSMFGGFPPQPVDQDGPVVTSGTANSAFLKGIVDLDFEVTDPLGIQSITFEVNGLFHSNGQAQNTSLSLNTTGYADGEITVRVTAIDVLNNETIENYVFNVDNTSPVVELSSDTLVNNQTYDATGTFQQEGSPISTITVNGVSAVVDSVNNTWSAQVALNSGQNTLSLVITDDVGNTGTNDVSVDVDLIKPTITPFGTQVTHTTFQGQLNLCTSGQLTPTSATGNPICLSTDNLSLNGTALSGDIQFQGYALLGFSPTDPQGAGVFTPLDNLVVEYMYEVNGVEVRPWTSAPKTINGSNQFYYFPMVTEFLGDTWYQTTTDDIHRVSFRATDNSGNFGELFYEIKVDVLVPAITVISDTTNKNLFVGASFSNRTAIDGQLVNVEYTLDNPSSSAYYISMDDKQAHDVAHTYTYMQRKNRVRLVTINEQRFKFTGGSGSWVTPTTVYNGQGQARAAKTTSRAGYQNISSDTITAPSATPWAARTYADLCASGTVGSVGFQTTSYYGLFNTSTAYQTVQNNSVTSIGYAGVVNNGITGGGCVNAATNPGFGSRMDWQARTRYTYETEPGYPRNESSDVVVNSNMLTERVTVFNNSLGREISPVNTWYRVPPKTTIRIIKAIRTPVLGHYNDPEVVTVPFSSYSIKNMDSTTTWTLDTDIDITRAIDPGDVSLLPNVTQFTETFGNGAEQYTVAR